MAEGTRSANRQRRSDAREKRRALAAEPFEALNEAAGDEQSEGAARSTLKQAATTAVVGALAAGVGGAAKALAERREEPEREEPEREQPEPNPEPDEDSSEEPQAQAVEEQEKEPKDEEDEHHEESADDSEHARGASMNDAKQIVAEAKQELAELMGAEVESVSGFHRSDGGWTVTLEVVNLRRIPDTTDVLSSYEVVLDDDRNLVSISETRRYRRSQVEEG